MSLSKVIVLNRDGTDDWESDLIRGVLWCHSIPSSVMGYQQSSQLEEKDALYVVVPTCQENEAKIISSQLTQTPLVLAGRHVTLEYLKRTLTPIANNILIYGEPYALIPYMVNNQRFLYRMRGKAVLGPLFDPRQYRTPPKIVRQNSWVSIMTSVGCQKRCGYCSYGAVYSCLYPKGFTRRSRPWQDIEKEIIDFMQNGIDSFSLLSDQLLSARPEENQELYLLAREWKTDKLGRPNLIFTISPREVLNNKHVFEAMVQSFHVYPRLSIDSFDNNTLSLLDMNFDASTALEAVRFIAQHKLPLRINYIFVRPGVTSETLRKEFLYLMLMTAELSYLNKQEKLLLAYDLFSPSLRILYGAPIGNKHGIRERYEADLPLEFLNVISIIQGKLQEEVSKVQADGNSDPLLTIVETGLKAVTKR